VRCNVLVRREPDIAEFIAHLPLFEGLHAGEIQRLALGATRRKLRRGEVLFRQGERVDGFYAVIYGRVALSVSVAGRAPRVTDIIGPRRSFGEAVMFLGKPYIVTATALGDSLVLHIAQDAVFAALDRDPRLARRMIASLSQKLHAAVTELESYSKGSSSRRVAAWLAKLVPPEEQEEATVVLPSTKRAVASKLNLSPEHLSRVLRALRKEGLIEVHGRSVAIPDVERLREWSSARA
jgi:CRP-like cAMP-binding protein